MISSDTNILVSSRIVHRPLPENAKQRQPDISLALKILDWKSCVPLKEGLVQTVADFERRLLGQGIERAASR
jgi:UDP-glucuronate decarboxylase